MAKEQDILIDELIYLLQGGNAHAGFKDAVSNLPANLRHTKPYDLPYSIWQLVEHIRIAQWDMVQFCINADHQSPKWPDEYWPQEAGPNSEEAWNQSIQQINTDREQFIELLKRKDIYKRLDHGNGQSILREALQIADHNAYHIAEIIVIRRLLKAWK